MLCWYQRILMYPLAIILAIGILRRDQKLHLYVLPLSIAGIFTSLYHYLLIKTTWFPPPPCMDGVPCTTDYLNWLGFINVPFLALTAFIIITFSMIAFALFQPNVMPRPNANGAVPRFDTANIAVITVSYTHLPQALAFLQHVITQDIASISVGQSNYGLLCRPDGGIVDDVFVYHPVSYTHLDVYKRQLTR